MPSVKRFNVVYIMPDGARKKEYLFATDKKMLIKNIEERNCIPLKVRRVHAFFSFSKHNNNDTLITFLKNIINFSEAGYSLNKALQISVDNESNSKFKRVVIDVINTINKGCTFSSALSLHKRWFTPTIVNLIKSGENSGKLIDVLKQSKSLIEREQSLAKSVVKNIIPSLALMAAGIAILFFNAFITLPKIMNSEFFTSTMSQHTGVGIKLIYATVKITPFLAASIVLLFFVFFCVYKIKQAKVERILLKIPLIKKLWFSREGFIQYYALAKLIEAGMPIDKSLRSVAETCKHKEVKRNFSRAANEIKAGNKEFAQVLPILNWTEKTLLKGVTTFRKAVEVFYIIADRKLDEYETVVRKLPVLAKTTTYFIIVYVIILLFMGIIAPYYKTLSSFTGVDGF